MPFARGRRDTQLDQRRTPLPVVELGRGESHAEMHEGRWTRRRPNLCDARGILGEGPYFCGSYSLADIAIAPHVMAATFSGSPSIQHAIRISLSGRSGCRRAGCDARTRDVFETLQRLQAEKNRLRPVRVHWRSDRLDWVMKNGFADWFGEEVRAGGILPARGQ